MQEALVKDQEVRKGKEGSNKEYVIKLPIIVGNWSLVLLGMWGNGVIYTSKLSILEGRVMLNICTSCPISPRLRELSYFNSPFFAFNLPLCIWAEPSKR